MAISFHNDGTRYLPDGRRRLASWIKEAVVSEGYRPGDIAYIFCSAERHREINRQYLSHDYFTDVITFDYSDLNGRIVSGDIFIDPETVADNARHYGADPQAEMRRVIIHGILHLCGYQDGTEDQRREMRAKEGEYLEKFQGR